MTLQQRLSRTVIREGAGLRGEAPVGDFDDSPASSTQDAPDKIFETDAPGWLTTTAQGALAQATSAVVVQTIEDDLPPPAATECAQSAVAVARFTEAIDALCGEYSPSDVAEVATDRPTGDEGCSDGLSFKDETGPHGQLTDEEIERVERGQLAQLDPIPDEIAVRRADDIQDALRQVREQIQAMEQSSERAVERLAQSTAESRRHLTPEFKSAGTARQLGVEIARIVDVMEARFERTEVASAKRVAELGAEIRQEIAQMIDALAARVSDLEQRSTPAVVDDVDDQRLPSTGLSGSDPGPWVGVWEPAEAVLGTASATDRTFGSATDFADGTMVALSVPESTSEGQRVWLEASRGPLEQALVEQALADNVRDVDPEPDSVAPAAFALDQIVEREQEPSPGRRARSFFSWLSSRPSRPAGAQPVSVGKIA
jgi:hypothetical protein